MYLMEMVVRNQWSRLQTMLTLSPCLVAGFGVLLIKANASWAQTTPDTGQSLPVLYYGWQTEANPSGWIAAENPSATPVTTESSFDAPIDDAAAQVVTQEAITPTDVAEPLPSASLDASAPLNSLAPDFVADHPPVALPDSSPIAQSTESDTIPLETPDAPLLDEVVPEGNGQIITGIQVRFLNKDGETVEGHTRPSIFTRELYFEPGEVYDPIAAQQGLNRILQLDIVRDADLQLEPVDGSADQVVLVVSVIERNPFVVGLGIVSPSPSALQGPFQRNPVLGIGPDEVTGLAAEANLRFLNLGGNDQDITLQVRGGESVFDTELVFTDPWIGDDPTGFAVNVFNQRSIQAVFDDGDEDVDLPNGNTPWVHRLGGGVQVFRPVMPDLIAALGVNYQRVSIHNSAFETETFNRDDEGEQLIVSDSDYDDLLTVNFSADLDRRDNTIDPTAGSRFRFGIDQAIPIGDANINFTRFGANFVQYIPLNLFGFAAGPRTLVVNAQAGTMLGDVPPYEAFNLDSGIVRGYGGDPIGTGSSFALIATEYRFPIANFSVFRRDIRLGGTLFGGYGTVLGTENEVIGEPAVTRDKPGDAWGYGLGLRAVTDFGVVRLEFSLSDEGDGQVLFTIGDRF